MKNCYYCGHEMVCVIEHDISHEDEAFSIMTELICPMCGSQADVYKAKDVWVSGRHLQQQKEGEE